MRRPKCANSRNASTNDTTSAEEKPRLRLIGSGEGIHWDLLREASKVDFVTASQQRDPAARLAYLARAVRNDPSNQVASITLEQLITRQSAFPKAPLCSFRHGASLLTASFSPDGKWVVTASEDHTARVVR